MYGSNTANTVTTRSLLFKALSKPAAAETSSVKNSSSSMNLFTPLPASGYESPSYPKTPLVLLIIFLNSSNLPRRPAGTSVPWYRYSKRTSALKCTSSPSSWPSSILIFPSFFATGFTLIGSSRLPSTANPSPYSSNTTARPSSLSLSASSAGFESGLEDGGSRTANRMLVPGRLYIYICMRS